MLAFVLAASGTAFAARQPAAAAAQVTVVGAVADTSGQPVSGATVVVSLLSKGAYTQVATRTTADDGSWTYGGKTGGYRFAFSADGGTPKTVDVEYASRGTYSLATQLLCCGTLTGLVVDSGSGLPVGGAEVYVYRSPGDGSWPSAPTRSVVAPDGRYTITDLETGVYRVEMSADGYVRAFLGGTTPQDVTVVRAASVAVPDVALELIPVPQTASVSGRITNSSGAGLYGFVYFFKQNADGTWPPYVGFSGFTRQVETSYDGTYTIGDLDLGVYRVRLFTTHTGSQWWLFQPSYDTAQSLVLATPGQVVTGIDAQFPAPVQ